MGPGLQANSPFAARHADSGRRTQRRSANKTIGVRIRWPTSAMLTDFALPLGKQGQSGQLHHPRELALPDLRTYRLPPGQA